ncbi:gamma-taxilin isoform X1 [Sardina pilchardus]|uniref:gamma-taxilin isoform X1 n=2 Tax=Sardina pilchardus TaxID=27697 RepID=UPI002E10B2AA
MSISSDSQVMEKSTQSISGPKNTPTDQMNGSEEEDTDPMDLFNQQLEDIIKTYGSAASLMEQQISSLEAVEDKDDQELEAVLGSASENETARLILSLEKIKSPEEKVKIILKKYAELAENHQRERKQKNNLQKKSDQLLMQKDQLQFDLSRAILARTKLEGLCREIQDYNKTLKVENLQRCQEDEKKRKEITTHFQSTLTDIQAQIEEHSNRNNKLCQENSDLAGKLNNIIHQYEKREESLEKIFKHHDMQQKLADAKIGQANMLLREAEAKHKREKEYLLKEAIDITKKCYAMKEQELQMKKQLVLYSQKFDEFQATLGKSNDVYVSFRNEMDKMTKKMKKLEKESGFWKTRFESCNKALMEQIEERSEKAKEFELFTIKVDKLETLCRALQEERKGLYDKIKGLRFDMSKPAMPEEPTVKTSEEDLPIKGFVLTAELDKLNAEQARLHEFAASLATSNLNELEDSDDEEENTECSIKMPPGELLGASSENSVSELGPCHEELRKEQIKPDGVETEIVYSISEQEIIQAEEVKTEPIKPLAQSATPLEAKTEEQAPEQVKQNNTDTEKACEHPARPEGGLSKEAISDAISPSVLKVEENQQELKNPQSVQENPIPVPTKPELAKAPEATVGTAKLQAGKQERKKSKIPKEKPVVEGAVMAEGTSPSQAQTQTSKSPSAKPQGKKQGTNKKKSQPKNVKK